MAVDRRADVLLIDGSNLAHRSWHGAGGGAYPTSVNFTQAVASAVALTKPTFGCVAFDDATSWRDALAPDRPTRPTPLGVTECIDVLRGLGRIGCLRVVVSPGHDADDVLATLVEEAQSVGHVKNGQRQPLQVVLATSDSDAWALLDYNVVAAPIGPLGLGQPVTLTEVKRRLGVLPQHILAYKALVGKPAAGVAGVPGVGPVSARRLLAPYTSREGREALESALDLLTAPPCRIPIPDAWDQALAGYNVLAARHRAPIKWHLRDLTLGVV